MSTEVKDFIIQAVSSRKGRAEDTLSEFRVRVADGISIKYLVSWSAAVIEAELTVVTLAGLERAIEGGFDPHEGLKELAERLSESLLDDRFNQGSTSAFSNAVDSAERQATSRLYGTVQDWLRTVNRKKTEEAESSWLPHYALCPGYGDEKE